MTLWESIGALLDEARDRTLGAIMAAMEARRRKRDAAIFSIALIALSAKMARADGAVSESELAAFRSFFTYPPKEERNVMTVFRLAMEDVAGFSSYARQVGRLFRDEPAILEDVLDCLFYVALADGVAHPAELDLLREAADAFGVGPCGWRRIKAAHLGFERDDPHVILGVEPHATIAEIKAAYHALVKEHHPDALTARGVPPALVKIAEHRMATINVAYEKLAGAIAVGASHSST
ncbi:Putative heat shock protein DnaJ [Parvularcula bermudensis HTCC2503]|uniref:Putative heat shock protein DnaJ n=1 Tax=Parvularcula bermudensis (strain ATCC BAA-594 / HTCC2503 / KCTC 12087) TaxID=314260 RepID=E0TDY6_PARBH|nr:TerB family tellurite resistance protein [Parvularcula bermudensis]ADM10435.1 Putative heat shock protein DnaJ [Parvularcula bermudensis HTCC2503]